jgi:hypothetical protein
MDANTATLQLSPTRAAPTTSDRRSQWPDVCWLVFCMAASSLWCVTAAPHLGPTYDEPNYVANGLERWRTGSYGPLLRQGTMPLPIDVISWPLYMWEKYRGEPFRVGLNKDKFPAILRDLPVLLPVARWGTLSFWCILLYYAWRIGWSAGPWGGRLAVALIASEPNLLAHATLATTDIAATACLLMLTFHFSAGRNRNWTRRVLIPGMLFGVALLAKASALVFWPLCFCAIELHRLWLARTGDRDQNRRSLAADVRASFRDAWQIGLIGMAAAFLYVGTEFRTESSFVAWAHSLPEGTLNDWMRFAADNLRIFPNAGEGLAYQVKHNIRGHGGVYLLGEIHERAVWYYFPLALAIKLSLAVLLLPPLIACLSPRALSHWALAAAGALLLFSITYHVQIGIRLVLPLVALLVIGTGAAVSRAWLMVESAPRRRLCAVLAVIATMWGATSSVLAWPHALAYTNELFRGEWHGGPALHDSNRDWGQGLVELDGWRREHGLSAIDVWYFGTDPAVNRPPFRSVPLHVHRTTTLAELSGEMHASHLAVSSTLLYGSLMSIDHYHSVQFLRGLRPVDRTTTFYIFDVSPAGSATQVAGHETPPAQR